MNYDLSPREAEMMDSYRELPLTLQENLSGIIISFRKAKDCTKKMGKEASDRWNDADREKFKKSKLKNEMDAE